MQKRLISLAIVFAVLITGCFGKTTVIDMNHIKEKHKKITIGVSLLTLQHKFFKDLKEGLEKTATDYGITIKIADSDMDLDKQISDIDSFISESVDGIIMSPVDSKGVTGVISKAKAAHIFVVTVDIAADGVKVDSYVASDNIMGGRLAGEYAAKLLKGKGNVAIIDHHVVSSVIDRVKGFEDVLAKYPKIRIVAKKDAVGIREKAAEATEEILKAHHDVDLIFAINDDTCMGAMSILEGMEEAKKIKLIAYDATPEQQRLIKQGSILKASVIQWPKEMGKVSVETVLRLLDEQKVEEKILIKVGIVDKSGEK